MVALARWNTASQRTAVVLDFHGYYDTGAIQEEESGFKQIGDEYNFIIAWPNGLDDTVVGGFDAYSWNAVGTVESPGPSGDTCKWAKEGDTGNSMQNLSAFPGRG